MTFLNRWSSLPILRRILITNGVLPHKPSNSFSRWLWISSDIHKGGNEHKGFRLFTSSARLQYCGDTSISQQASGQANRNIRPMSVSFGDFTLIDSRGKQRKCDIEKRAHIVANCLCEIFEVTQLNGMRIALLCRNDVSYVVALWAIWLADGVAVPLSSAYPAEELKYFIEDSQSQLLLHTSDDPLIQSLIDAQNVPSLKLDRKDYDTHDSAGTVNMLYKQIHGPRRAIIEKKMKHDLYRSSNALIIYTSGTTGKPKGVVHTHRSLQAQVQGMVTAWDWKPNDVILHVLPLHHVHGIVNALLTPMVVGATCIMLNKPHVREVWLALLAPTTKRRPELTLFMAVPTIYSNLLRYYDEKRKANGSFLSFTVDDLKARCLNKRLMVSGSAALPLPVMDRWEKLTGHTLLERYGMTEIGMALTNPLHGNRMPGHVGMPFPLVQARIVQQALNGDTQTQHVVVEASNTSLRVDAGDRCKHVDTENTFGDLQIKGACLFKEYHNKPDATQEAFTHDGWFITGDTASVEQGSFRIQGRTSVDIIKSAGYKISALDIECHLLAHASVKDVAVLGVPNETYGEVIAAVVVSHGPETSLTETELTEFCTSKMASYQKPRLWKIVDEIPRNAMGKVNKKQLLKTYFLHQ